MKKFFLLTLAITMWSATAAAEVAPGGVVNAASFGPFGMPGSAIARGSLFLVFGSDLGAPGLAQATEFPLPLILAGTSVQVETGGVVVDCAMVFTTPGQIAALLPSSTPAGSGEIRVTYNGVVSTGRIEVAETSVGVFAQSQAGIGPGIVQNFENAASTPLNTLLQAARPGQAIILWVTGLGAVEGAEADGPLPGVRPAGVTVRVYIDGVQAQIVDFGRSGCCAGLDQIVAIVPDGIDGCFASVIVVTEKDGIAVTSNTTSIAVSPEGGVCRDEGGYAPAELTSAEDSVRYGVVSLARGRVRNVLPPAGEGIAISDTFNGTFFEVPKPQFFGALPPTPALVGRPGACFTFAALGDSGGSSAVTFLDAGESLTVNGTGGATTAAKFEPGPTYQGAAVEQVELNGQPQPPLGTLFLGAGDYQVDGPGGPDVGSFSISETLPGLFEWTNLDDTTVSRAAPRTVSWSGAAAAPGVVMQVSGTSTATNEFGRTIIGSFICFADPAAGSFEIPAYIVGSMPASELNANGLHTGSITLVLQSRGKRFSATGLDFGILTFTVGHTAPAVTYE